MDQKDYEQIEAYIAGRLRSLEKAEFEKKIKENPEFAHEVRLHRELQQSLGRQDSRQLSQTIKNIYLHENRETQSRRFSTMRFITGIAASIIIIFAAFFLFNQSTLTSDEIYEQNADFPSSLNVNEIESSRDGTLPKLEYDRLDSTWALIVENYNSKNLDQCRLLLSEILSIETDTAKWHFVNGLVLMEFQNYQEAKAEFAKASNYKDIAIWYEALLSIKLNDLDRSKTLLESMVSTIHPRSNEARRVLLQIEKIRN